jgi:hypothetical protein
VSAVLFIIVTCAVWRLTHLLAKEDGPFDIIFWLREKAGASFFGSLLDCFYCLSLWIAIPFAFYAGSNWKEIIIFWLAFSGAACLAEKISSPQKKYPDQPDYFEDKK